MNNRAFITALVRGLAFALITLIYSIVPIVHGLLWCVYIGFFLTMAFGVRKEETPNYICSLLSGYVWALGYLFGPVALSGLLPTIAALTLSEMILTFLLIFIHVKYLHGTWLNKVPAVFAAVATVFASEVTSDMGLESLMASIALCATSAVIGILMAIGTEVIIVALVRE